ncbi:MAG: Cna B-type domain-containing protein [Clostridiales bacterium]|nr:Cna B-type domain-containing protein [Clostridiales bacterium]
MLKIKSTGARTTFSDVDIEIKSKDNSILIYDLKSLEKLKDESWFDSYDIDKDGVLHLKANELESGRYYDVPIRFTTKNGLTKDGEKMLLTAKFTSKELNKDAVTSEPILVNSSSPLKINKKLLGNKATDVESKMMRYGIDTYWLTRAAIDASSTGQQFIKEGTKITITETYDEHLVYKGMQEGYPEPTSVDEINRTLSWEFDAPTYGEQEESINGGDSALWQQELIVIYGTVDEPNEGDPNYDKIIKNIPVTTKLSFTNFSDQLCEDEDTVEVDLYPGKKDIPQLHGSWNVFGTWGPLDGEGNHGYASTADMDTKPTVYGNDTLSFAHRLSSMYNGKLSGYKEYVVNYYIDDYLDLKQLRVPLTWWNYPDLATGSSPIDYMPNYKILLLGSRVDMDIEKGSNVAESGIIATLELGKDFNHGSTIDIRGVTGGAHVTQVQYVFTDTPPGMFSPTGAQGVNMFKYDFNISKNWRESAKYDTDKDRTLLKNDISIFAIVDKDASHIADAGRIAEVWDYTKETIESDNSSWLTENGILASKMYQTRDRDGNVRYDGFEQSNHWEVNGPRLAYVTSDPEAYKPTVTNKISLLDSEKGTVYLGENKLQITLENHSKTSVGNISAKGLESYVMVPINIKLDESKYTATKQDGSSIDIKVEKMDLDNNLYNYYKISWLPNSEETIPPKTKLSVVFDVNLVSGFSGLTVHVFTDLVKDRDFNTLTVDPPALTDTIIISDELNLTGKGEDYKLLKSSNQYHMVDQYLVVTSKQVKGDLDSEYTSDGLMNIDGKASYRLQFKNNVGREIKSLTLMDVLPSVGDLGITDGVSRGSEFALVLTGPIGVDEEKFEVLYSTSRNPKRDDLNVQLNIDGFDKVSNPLDSEDPAWMLADEVSDWSEIHSFLITLKQGQKITINEGFQFDFDAVIENPADIDAIEKSYVAWNSFAMTIDGIPIIEPLRVAIRTPKTPVVELTVNKVWKGEDENRPKSVRVQLYKDGVASGEEVILNQDNNWTYTWNNLEESSKWTVDERDVPKGYKKSVQVSGTEYTITNTKVKDNSILSTGDDSNLTFFIVMMGIALAGIGVLLYPLNRTRKIKK